MNKEFAYKTIKPILIFIILFSVGFVFQIISCLRLFYGQRSLIYLILSLFVMMVLSKGNIKMYGFKKAKIKIYIISILITFIYVFICSIVQFRLLQVCRSNSMDTDTPIFLLLFTSIIIAPVAEEFMTRGYLQTSLAHLNNKGIRLFKVYINLPVIISALLFGLAHLGNLASDSNFLFVFYIIIYSFLLGIISGYFKEKSGSIYPSCAIHSFANFLSPVFISMFIHFF